MQIVSPTFGAKSKATAMLCAILLFAGLIPTLPAQSASTNITFTNSIKEPAPITANKAAIVADTPAVVRVQLSDAELQATIDFSIALKMRNFAELQQRVGMHEIISLEEMRAKYFPAPADVGNVRQWLTAEGFEVLPAAQYELSVFARGTVAQLQQAFGVTFARVQFRGEEHTSAITAPSLPTDVAGPVLSINGLQPHLHAIQRSALSRCLLFMGAFYSV
jgi:subtilase family serine protease